MAKVLFLTLHRPDRSPSQRFRFEQYIEFLNENGYECSWSYLLNAEDDKKLYTPKNYFQKFIILLKSTFKRLKEVYSKDKWDLIFVQREAFMLGTTFFEKRFAKKGKMIFDFDDSIWMQNVSAANKNIVFLKNPEKTSELIKMSKLIFAGNDYLKDYAAQYNKNIVIVPTTIDTEEYQRKKVKKDPNKICIGWSGSITTIQHFETAIPYLKEIKAKYGDKVYFKVIGDQNYVNDELGIQGIAWQKQNELEELSEIDIGIMPLPDDKWANGKCGLKGLQYMALEIATIMSAVGVNTEIIENGVNGYLAIEKVEWFDAVSKLIDSEEHRLNIGKAGRKTVVERYSVDSTKQLYLDSFNNLLKS